MACDDVSFGDIAIGGCCFSTVVGGALGYATLYAVAHGGTPAHLSTPPGCAPNETMVNATMANITNAWANSTHNTSHCCSLYLDGFNTHGVYANGRGGTGNGFADTPPNVMYDFLRDPYVCGSDFVDCVGAPSVVSLPWGPVASLLTGIFSFLITAPFNWTKASGTFSEKFPIAAYVGVWLQCLVLIRSISNFAEGQSRYGGMAFQNRCTYFHFSMLPLLSSTTASIAHIVALSLRLKEAFGKEQEEQEKEEQKEKQNSRACECDVDVCGQDIRMSKAAGVATLVMGVPTTLASLFVVGLTAFFFLTAMYGVFITLSIFVGVWIVNLLLLAMTYVGALLLGRVAVVVKDAISLKIPKQCKTCAKEIVAEIAEETGADKVTRKKNVNVNGDGWLEGIEEEAIQSLPIAAMPAAQLLMAVMFAGNFLIVMIGDTTEGSDEVNGADVIGPVYAAYYSKETWSTAGLFDNLDWTVFWSFWGAEFPGLIDRIVNFRLDEHELLPAAYFIQIFSSLLQFVIQKANWLYSCLTKKEEPTSMADYAHPI